MTTAARDSTPDRDREEESKPSRWARARVNAEVSREASWGAGVLASGRPAGLSRPPFHLYMIKGVYSLIMSLLGLRLSVPREDFVDDETWERN